jgi:hypothetical protein
VFRSYKIVLVPVLFSLCFLTRVCQAQESSDRLSEPQPQLSQEKQQLTCGGFHPRISKENFDFGPYIAKLQQAKALNGGRRHQRLVSP